MVFHPCIDGGVPLDSAVKSQQIPFSSSWSFESYLLVPGRHAFLVLHGIAEAFGLDAELA
jgi:hypothetical protein